MTRKRAHAQDQAQSIIDSGEVEVFEVETWSDEEDMGLHLAEWRLGKPGGQSKFERGGVRMETRTVTIPRYEQHEGIYSIEVTLPWVCPVCGGPRGEPYPVRSYDGSRCMIVDGWKNECGHVDRYSDVRKEVAVA